MLVNHLGASGCGQLGGLLSLISEIDRSRRQFQIEFDRLPLELAYYELHVMRVMQGTGNGEPGSGFLPPRALGWYTPGIASV
jgi:hypothetical protein